MPQNIDGLLALIGSLLTAVALVIVAAVGKRPSGDKRLETDVDREENLYERIDKLTTENDSLRARFYALQDENIALKNTNSQLITVRDNADRDRLAWETKEAQYKEREADWRRQIRAKDSQIAELHAELMGRKRPPADGGTGKDSR